MINIEIRHGCPMYVKANGHATGAGPEGNNLVCCAISTLMFTMASAAEELDINAAAEMDKGYAKITMDPSGEDYETACVLFKTITTGLRALAKQAPEYILIEEVKENG